MVFLQGFAGLEHHLLDAVDREVVVRRQLAPSALVQPRDEGKLAEDEHQGSRIDGAGDQGREEGLGLGGKCAAMVGVADPGPVEQRADQQDQAVPGFQLAKPSRHPGDPLGMLARLRGRDRRQERGRELLGADPLECIRIGEDAGDRLESGRFHVDELASDPLAHGRAQGRDHALARIDRHIAETLLVVLPIDVGLGDHRDGGQPIDARLDILLERRGQRHGQAVIGTIEQLLAHPDGEIARPVDDRQDPDPRADRQEIVRSGSRPVHRWLRGVLGPDSQSPSSLPSCLRKGDASRAGGRTALATGVEAFTFLYRTQTAEGLASRLSPLGPTGIRKKSGRTGGSCRLHPSRGHDQAEAAPTVAVPRANPGHGASPASGRRGRRSACRPGLLSQVLSPSLDQPRNARPTLPGDPGEASVGLSCALLRLQAGRRRRRTRVVDRRPRCAIKVFDRPRRSVSKELVPMDSEEIGIPLVARAAPRDCSSSWPGRSPTVDRRIEDWIASNLDAEAVVAGPNPGTG